MQIIPVWHVLEQFRILISNLYIVSHKFTYNNTWWTKFIANTILRYVFVCVLYVLLNKMEDAKISHLSILFFLLW